MEIAEKKKSQKKNTNGEKEKREKGPGKWKRIQVTFSTYREKRYGMSKEKSKGKAEIKKRENGQDKNPRTFRKCLGLVRVR